MNTALVSIPSIDVSRTLGGSVQNLLDRLVGQLQGHQARNRLRSSYYDMQNAFRDLGIAIPPNLRNLEIAMGWPAKAVDQLANRLRLEGFVLPGADGDPFGVDEAWTANRMASLVPQATTSALIHGAAFVLTTPGPAGPVITVHDALHATGLWDAAGRELHAALVITKVGATNEAERILLVTPMAYAQLEETRTGWTATLIQHNLGRVPVEPLVFRPNLTRPFGSSRISRAVMTLTDSAMRTVVRAEVGAEFYSAPQRYLLGADEDMFVGPDGTPRSTWELVMGRILAIPADDDGADQPTVGQFPQISMQPHADQMRMWAQMFAGETSLPISALGIVQDNPASAEAIYASKEDLIVVAEGAADGFSSTWLRTAITAVQLRDGASSPPPELGRLGVRWRDPSTPSRAAATDAVMKQIAAGVLPADSDVAMEQLGYDPATIARVKAHRLQAGPSGTQLLADALTRAQTPTTAPTEDDPAKLKARFDALGVAIRSGVDPQDAALKVGLADTKFTGATPVALRLPETQAASLEER